MSNCGTKLNNAEHLLGRTCFDILIYYDAVLYNKGVPLAALAQAGSGEIEIHTDRLGEGSVPVCQEGHIICLQRVTPGLHHKCVVDRPVYQRREA